MKRFNTTGTCIEKKHYMVNIDKKIEQIEAMIDDGYYFVINKPRQFGKTTTISKLSKKLRQKYLVIRSSFEGIGDDLFKSEESFSSNILGIFADTLEFIDEEKSVELRELGKNAKNMNDVSKAITKFIKNSDKEVILFIDEVDKNSNNQLFISFLGMLRNKFLLSQEDLDLTFKSIVLAGVHDIKNLKVLVRQDEEKKYNSPWNIAVKFDIDMSFNEKEIQSMLNEYCEINNVVMDTEYISKEIYFYTNGYPFLVSRLCQIIDEEILQKKKQPWIKENIDRAVKLILQEKNTLFDSLIKNIENNKEMFDYVKEITINGVIRSFNLDNPIIETGAIYGFFKNDDGNVKMNNRIFDQRVYNYMISKLENIQENINEYNYKNNFITKDNGLDFEKILLKFQQFIKEQYSEKDDEFLERQGGLLFLAFIKPIINGVGFDFKEVQISEEKRLDIVITYNQFKYVVELKKWRGEKYHKRGLEQLDNYLEVQGMDEGYLVVFNFNKNKEYKSEVVKVNGKSVFTIFV